MRMTLGTGALLKSSSRAGQRQARLSRQRMTPESPGRWLIPRCYLRSLFLLLEILSLSNSSRMPLAALQVTLRILFHLVPPTSRFFMCLFIICLSMAVKLVVTELNSNGAVHINR
jgi:hypothetical protein